MTLPTEKFYSLADRTHILGALSFTLLGGLFFGSKGAGISFIPILIWASLKEFIYDERYESEEERGSNLRDFLGYVLGGFIGLVCVTLAMVYKGEL